MKKIFFSFVLTISILLLLSSVYAFGVTTWYWEGNPLKLEPGETKEIYLELQNMVGDNDVNAEVKLIKGSEVAQIIDSSNIYSVPAKTKDTKVNVRVSVPETDQIGKTYTLGFSIQTVNPAGGGVGLSTGFEKEFDVEVAEKPKPAAPEVTEVAKKGFPWFTLVIAIAIVVVLAIIVKKANKKKLK